MPDPGYEYPPDPDVRFTDHRRSDDGDDMDDDDDSDNTDEHVVDANSKRDNRNCLTNDKSTNNRNNIDVHGKYGKPSTVELSSSPSDTPLNVHYNHID